MDFVNIVHEQFHNPVYSFFLGKHTSYPVVVNYVKNTWSKFGLVKSMMNSKDVFFFKFNSKTGMDAMLEKGPWLICNMPLILKKNGKWMLIL